MSEPANVSPKRKNLAIALLWFSIAFLAFVSFWSARVRPYYVEPEYAELVNTTAMYHPHVADWFTGPVNRYSTTYTEWTSLSRDFIRPVVAINYYIWSRIFASNFAAYLLGSYLFMAGLCGLTFYISAEILGLGLPISHLTAALVFFSPANGEQELFQSTFVPDPMAAFWVLAATLAFLRQRYVISWLFIVLAVGTKETAWPISIGMAALFLTTANLPRWRRVLGTFSYLLPLAILLCLRVHAFGLNGILKGDQATAAIKNSPLPASMPATGSLHGPAALLSGPVGSIASRLIKWPFGIIHDSSQYDGRIASIFSVLSGILNACFWLFLAVVLAKTVVRLWKSGSRPQQLFSHLRSHPAPHRLVTLVLFGLTLASLFFPVRFGSPPRYGASTYPLVFLSAATFLTPTSPALRRIAAWVLLISIGMYGFVLRLSDMTHGVEVYRRSGQLEQSFLAAIKSSEGHPLFVVDDVAGGENNADAFRRVFGPNIQLVRVNDLATSCWVMPERGPSPVQLDVSAWRSNDKALVIHSSIQGCGAHQFFEVPGLPDDPIGRTSEGYHLSYNFDPRQNPQPTEGAPREMTVTIEGAPANSIVITPDFSRRAYRSIPIR